MTPSESAPIAASAPSVPTISIQEQAQQGDPSAIARHLSPHFSELGVAIRARIAVLEQSDAAEICDRSQPASRRKRLIVRCESAYSPDPSLLAAPIAQRLRDLELQGFCDAAVFGLVRGERKPEWVLRVDLTPPEQILREWARWGDLQAIVRLLNRSLKAENLHVSVLSQAETLHLTCRSTTGTDPDLAQTIAAIAPLLTAVSPQGILGATLYGIRAADAQISATIESTLPESPLWVQWVDLPAATEPALAIPTLVLAQQGNLDAIAFLVSRVLNPDLSAKLATGGIRIQIRRKDDLLHIMTDALTCPVQQQVGSAIGRCLQPLQIPDVAGIRVYGRRAGQKQPLWSYGIDFASRSRLVPEVTPEFAASDAYVSELLEPAGAIVLRTESPQTGLAIGLKHWLDGAVQRVQRSLIATQLFIPAETAPVTASAAKAESPAASESRGKVALVWGTVGVLLMVQADWLLGRWLQDLAALSSPQPAASPIVAPGPAAAIPPTPSANQPQLPALSLRKSQPTDREAFDNSGFTQPGTKPPSPPAQSHAAPTSPDALPASPLQASANLPPRSDEQDYPTFNSRQLDEKLALYRQYLIEQGPPDVLIIGSSRALRGVDPIALQTALTEQGKPKLKIFNFGINGATAQVVDLIIRQLLPQEALPKLILWADGARAFNSGRSDITHGGIVASQGYRMLLAGKPPIPGTLTAQGAPAANSANPSDAVTSPTASQYQAMNQAISNGLGAVSLTYGQRDRLKAALRDKLAALLPTHHTTQQGAVALQDLSDVTSPAAASSSPAVLAEGQAAIDINGFLPLPNRFNPATYYQKYSRVAGDYDSDYESFNLQGKQTEALTTLAQFARDRQIPLVFVNLPLTNDYLDAPRKRYEEQFQQYMLQQAAQLSFTYRDLGQELLNQPDYFSDPSHLNRYGGYAVSRRLAHDVMIPWNQ